MNKSSLTNLSPPYFRIIGYIQVVVSLFIGLYNKFSTTSEVSHDSYLLPQVLILCGLLIIISSKQKIEDERTLLIRQQIWNHGYWLTLGFLIFKILLTSIYGGSIGSADTVSLLIGIAIIQVIIFEVSKVRNLIDWIEEHDKLYLLFMIIFLLAFYIFNQWFWYA